MEIDQQAAVVGRAGDLFVEIDHLLVGALHEVDLDALHAPVAVGVENTREVLLHRVPERPEDHAHALFVAVADDLLQIDLLARLADVERAHRPSLVEQDVLQSVAGGEVDEVLVGGRVHAGLEIHAVDVQPVPPVPRDLAGAQPRGVALDGLRGQLVGEVVLQQRAVVLIDGHHAPRVGARAFRHGDVVGFAEELLVAVRTLLQAAFEHHGRKFGAEPAALAAEEEHAGVVLQVGLGDDHARAARRGEIDGQVGIDRALQLREPLALEERLAMGDEVRVPLAGPVGVVVGGEVELGGLVLDDRLAPACGLEAVGRAVVIDAQPHGPVAAEGDQQFVAAVVQLAELRRDLGRRTRVDGFGADAPHRGGDAQRRLAGQREADAARFEEPLACAGEAPPQLGLRRYLHLDLSVGGGDGVFPGGGRCRGRQRGGDQKESFHGSHSCL